LICKNLLRSILIIFNLAIIGINPITVAPVTIPVTGINISSPQSNIPTSTIPTFQTFVESVADGSPMVRGVYISDILALEVIQQPDNQPAFVSIEPGTATQFRMASSFGSIGLLAHNYLGGASFDDASVGNRISVVYGDGRIEEYKISSIVKFQALNPTYIRTDFLDISTQTRVTANDLFGMVYGGEPHLTLQTCIKNGLESSWGRLFVIAEPVISKN
jgi:hypothetical protein